jgi:hypothetical protein
MENILNAKSPPLLFPTATSMSREREMRLAFALTVLKGPALKSFPGFFISPTPMDNV